MVKRIVCLGVFLTVMFGLMVPAFSSSEGARELKSSYVEFKNENGGVITSFPAAGSKVIASTKVSNNGETEKAAVFWVGVYVNNALKDIEYQRRVIPAGITYTFTAHAVTIPAGAASENTDIRAYVWDSFTGSNAVAASANMLKDSGQLRDIRIDGVLIEGFNNEKEDYTYLIPADTAKRPKITADSLDNATKVEISSYKVPGQANIKVTRGDGTVKTFTIEMKFGPGKVTNLANNLGKQVYQSFSNLRPKGLVDLKQLYSAVGSQWEEYCKCYVDRYVSGFSDTADMYKLPSDSVAYTGTGNYITDYTGSWFTMWISQTSSKGDSSPYFNGASWIATGNNEKASPYMTEAHDDAITFTIDRGATIWIASNNSTATNFAANGWVQSTAGYKLYHADGAEFKYLFTKHFDAGDVKIPSQGIAVSRMYIPVIIWDEVTGFDNADLASVSYKLPGEEAYTDLEGVSADIDTYSIDLPSTADPDDIPVLNVVPADSRSQVDISYPETVPGTAAIITITSVSGIERKYTINFVMQNQLAAGLPDIIKNKLVLPLRSLFFK